MPEPNNNGAQPNPDHLVHGNYDLVTTASGTVQLEFFSEQAHKTVAHIHGWGMTQQALEVSLQQALETLRAQRTGIVKP
jgi:hypothetical protein